jgi:hypothetical protein
MDFVLTLHSIVRWVIVIVALAAIVRFALVWAGKAQGSNMDRGLMYGFSGLLDLQVLLGLIYLVWNGLSGAGFPLFRLEHALIMIVAVVIAHLSMRWKNAEAPIRARNNLFAIVASSVLIFIGVAIVGGWVK